MNLTVNFSTTFNTSYFDALNLSLSDMESAFESEAFKAIESKKEADYSIAKAVISRQDVTIKAIGELLKTVARKP